MLCRVDESGGNGYRESELGRSGNLSGRWGDGFVGGFLGVLLSEGSSVPRGRILLRGKWQRTFRWAALLTGSEGPWGHGAEGKGVRARCREGHIRAALAICRRWCRGDLGSAERLCWQIRAAGPPGGLVDKDGHFGAGGPRRRLTGRGSGEASRGSFQALSENSAEGGKFLGRICLGRSFTNLDKCLGAWVGEERVRSGYREGHVRGMEAVRRWSCGFRGGWPFGASL